MGQRETQKIRKTPKYGGTIEHGEKVCGCGCVVCRLTERAQMDLYFKRPSILLL